MKPLTHGFQVAACGFELVNLRSELAVREFELVTRGFELITLEVELVARKSELETRIFELLTCTLLFHFLLNDPN